MTYNGYNRTEYEWQILWEELDENYKSVQDDLDDTNFYSLKEIKNNIGGFTDTEIKQGYKLCSRTNTFGMPESHIIVYRIRLVKYYDMEILTDTRIVDKKLEYFDNGNKIPKRFIDDFNRNYKWASLL